MFTSFETAITCFITRLQFLTLLQINFKKFCKVSTSYLFLCFFLLPVQQIVRFLVIIKVITVNTNQLDWISLK